MERRGARLEAGAAQYAAIHFHDDDLHDCGWADDFSFTVPKDMKSGVWGMQLRCGPHRDVIPFFVRPRSASRGKVCYIASTFTYQVYTNFSRGVFNEPFRKRVADWKAAANNPDDTRITGSRPTTSIATARAWPIPRICGRC